VQSSLALAAVEAPQLSGQRQSRNQDILKSCRRGKKDFFTLATNRAPATFALAAILF